MNRTTHQLDDGPPTTVRGRATCKEEEERESELYEYADGSRDSGVRIAVHTADRLPRAGRHWIRVVVAHLAPPLQRKRNLAIAIYAPEYDPKSVHEYN